jgi:hypothetical protein
MNAPTEKHYGMSLEGLAKLADAIAALDAFIGDDKSLIHDAYRVIRFALGQDSDLIFGPPEPEDAMEAA